MMAGPRPAVVHERPLPPLFALQELGGWESSEMVRRYAHLAVDGQLRTLQCRAEFSRKWLFRL
jgi:hypothetical protein